MILPWMLYASGVTLLLGLAAWALEDTVRQRGWPVRGLWLLALAGSLFFPALAVLPPATPAALPAPFPAPPPPSLPAPMVDALVEPVAWTRGVAIAALPSTIDPDPWLLGLWGVASVSCVLGLLLSHRRLARRRRGWTEREVEGRTVWVSTETGPAVVGFFPGRVVVPEWLLGAGAREREIVLAHEEEHLRAGDPRLLLATLVISAVLPWNVGLWWIGSRIRRAVEIDCDLRVLARGVSPRVYGRLLVEVTERGSAHRLVVAALSGSPSFLERRIRLMLQPRPRGWWARAGGSCLLAGCLALAACRVERPAAPLLLLTRTEHARPLERRDVEPPGGPLSTRPDPVVASRRAAGLPASPIVPGLPQVSTDATGQPDGDHPATDVLPDDDVRSGPAPRREPAQVMVATPTAPPPQVVARLVSAFTGAPSVPRLAEQAPLERERRAPTPPTGEPRRYILRGVVIDGESGSALAGAMVVQAGSQRGVLTDAEGRFLLSGFARDTQELVVAHLGYDSLRTTVVAGGDEATLRLSPNPIALAGIRVTADRFRARRNAVGTSAEVFEREHLARSSAPNVLEFLKDRVNLSRATCAGWELLADCSPTAVRRPARGSSSTRCSWAACSSSPSTTPRRSTWWSSTARSTSGSIPVPTSPRWHAADAGLHRSSDPRRGSPEGSARRHGGSETAVGGRGFASGTEGIQRVRTDLRFHQIDGPTPTPARWRWMPRSTAGV